MSSPIICDQNAVKIACEKCSLADFCLPFGLTEHEIHSLDSLIEERRVIHKGDVLFKQNERFTKLYALRSGVLKSTQRMDNGKLQTVNFHFPGELIGFEAIYSETHNLECLALDTCSLCIIPYQKLLELSNKLPSLNQQIMKLLSENIVSAAIYTLQDTAEERLAKFLLNISARIKRAGASGSQFMLPSAKQDIADYLGLANETLSRIFKKWTAASTIKLNRRELVIHDFRNLQKLACGR